jgi:predicted TIM-barrel fold metal-dependent hydrolase
MSENATEEPLVIVSADTHIGPRLIEDLRPYCPAQHLDDFDEYAKPGSSLDISIFAGHPNQRTLGHFDARARLADYDYDGVAAGVIFHGSQNPEPFPFGAGSKTLIGGQAGFDRELAAVGKRIYNEWLADFVSDEPHRHVGLAQLPMWDIEASTKELERAHDAGLRGVNFPVMQDGLYPEYNDPAWEPFWAVCDERQLPLVTHLGFGGNADYSGPNGFVLAILESNGWLSRRAIWWMIWGGVFERHPSLKLVITETPGAWWVPTAKELDSQYLGVERSPVLGPIQKRDVPLLPSEYMARNVYFGASFAAPFEAQQALDEGIEDRFLWGSDYPHNEGTFVYSDGDDDVPSVTKLALRNTFCNIPEQKMRQMVGGNAVELFGLDEDTLKKVALKIGAPTAAEMAEPIAAKPEMGSVPAFRSDPGGSWS